MIQVVSSPTSDWLTAQLRGAKSLEIASPYLSYPTCEFLEQVKELKSISILTDVRWQLVAQGSQCTRSLRWFLTNKHEVRTTARLHAKVFIVDRKLALIGSANATRSGLGLGTKGNYECGLATDEPDIVGELTRQIEFGFGSGKPDVVATTDVNEIEKLASQLRQKFKSLRALMDEAPGVLGEVGLTNVGTGEVTVPEPGTLDGWKQLVHSALVPIGTREFSAAEAYDRCVPVAATSYRDNRNPEAKVRQILQQLRNIGLVEFLGDGRYRLL